jgi:pyruvate dehydrogenase E2 component (dihydrolipoamide acetyltransferase)
MTEFKIPELGENIATGDVTKVLVNVGDTITREQPVLELETDKATIEVPSSVAGVVKEIRVKKGDKVKVGAVVLTVDAPASGNGDRAAAAKTPPPDAAPSLDAPPVAAPQSASASAQASASSRVVPMPVRQTQESALAPATAPLSPARPDGRAAPASPAVRRLAREIGVNINDVEGTGPNGASRRKTLRNRRAAS